MLDSVHQQSLRDIEHIVIDGGSKDGSVEVLAQYPGVNWISEPDKGISDAMNKGLQRSSGDFIVFLNADDYLSDPEVLERAVSRLKDRSTIYAFDIFFESSDGRRRKISPRPFNWWVNFKNPFPTQGVAVPKALFDRYGLFDSGLEINMDYDFWMRTYRDGTRVVRISEVLAIMSDGGISSRRDWPGLSRRLHDERRIHYRYVQSGWIRLAYLFYWPMYIAYRRVKCFARRDTLDNE